MRNNKAPLKICYKVTERNGKGYWERIGVAYTNIDGSLNVVLDSLPVDGKMQIREQVSFDGKENNNTEPSDKL